MPSFDCAAFEFDTEDPLELPAQTGDMDDLFEDATTEDVQSREQNEHPSLPIHGACLEDSGDPSATESESDGDILDFFTDLVRQRGPGRSADRGESHQDSTGRLSQQTFVDYSDDLGAPFDIPDMFTPNLGGVNSSFEYSQQSLPEVAKDFFDMFQGTGSYPDDFPMSLR
jgi:hypothetical protein